MIGLVAELELFLIDEKGNATREIIAEPIIVKKKYRQPYLPSPVTIAELSAAMAELYRQVEPSKDLVPLGIQISNVGDMPAQEIHIFLTFPGDCELFEEHDVIEGYHYLFRQSRLNHIGITIDEENKCKAHAWVNTLGNDLMMKNFTKVYVRFPEKGGKYKVNATITQHNFPPKNFEFSIIVKPKIIEE